MNMQINHRLLSRPAKRARWISHLASWKTYALAGGASLAAGTSADAQIVHTVLDDSINGVNALSSIKFAINGHNVTAVQTHKQGTIGNSLGNGHFSGAGIKFFRTSGFAANYNKSRAIGGAKTGSGSVGVLRSVNKLANGKWNTNGNFGDANHANNRAAAVTGYVGFQTNGANHDKGWIEVIVGPSVSSRAGVAIEVVAYAYNSGGGPINAGQTSSVPEPGTMALALMAAGAAGVASIRRARSKFAALPPGDENAHLATEAVA